MDDFQLDEVLTIQSEYQPNLNDIPEFESNTSLGLRKLRKKPRKKRVR